MAVVPVYQHKKLYETFWRLVNRQPRTAPFVWQIGLRLQGRLPRRTGIMRRVLKMM
jgi:hypothetical protein